MTFPNLHSAGLLAVLFPVSGLFAQPAGRAVVIDFAFVRTQYSTDTPDRCIAVLNEKTVILRDIWKDGAAGPVMYFDLPGNTLYECRNNDGKPIALQSAFPPQVLSLRLVDTVKMIAGYSCLKAMAFVQTGATRDSLEIWYTPALAPRFCPVAAVPGLALEFEFISPELGKTRLQARAIEILDYPDTGFSLSDYTIVDRIEHQAQMARKAYRMDKRFGHIAPDFTAPTLDGDTFHLAKEIARGRTIVINFWFIGCPPCEEEIPSLNEIKQKFEKKNDVIFLAVALDPPNQLKGFLNKKPFHFKIIGNGREISRLYKVDGYPINLVISPNGRIFSSTPGYLKGITDKMLLEDIGFARRKKN